MRSRAVWLLIAAVLVCSCSPQPDNRRVALDVSDLLSPEFVPPAPVENKHFMPTADAAAALHDFNGAIVIPEHGMGTSPPVVVPAEIAGKKTQIFPGIALEFVSHKGRLVPVSRGILEAEDSDSFWQINVAPGHVWSEPGDDDWSRASFPFYLTSNIENETYHGLATFLYDEANVSSLNYQIVHQLTPFLVETWFTAVGQVPIEYQVSNEDRSELMRGFESELADRLQWRNWSQLEAEYGAETLVDFDSGIEPSKTVISGLVVDDTIYLRTAATPWGDYPYPQEMGLGIWSASKTVAGLATLMRMAQKYGDEVLDYKIKDYIEVTADHDGWEKVTFGHALSMATGIGVGTNDVNPNRFTVDYIASDVDEYTAWFLAPTLAEKVDYVFQSPSYPWGPGEQARYRDRDYFILAAALDSLLRRREGEDADLWSMMTEEVYRPIGIHHLQSTGTKDAGLAMVPFLGWGIYATLDDLAKVARLLQDGGSHNGEQLLSRAGIAEAFYETDVRGLPTGASNDYGAKSYHLSLWHENFVGASGRVHTAPKMVGWGGVIVQMMPNGMIGFRIGNGGAPAIEQMMLIADKMRPFDEQGRR